MKWGVRREVVVLHNCPQNVLLWFNCDELPPKVQLTGLLLLLAGVAVLVICMEYDLLITNRFFTLPSFVIATGVIVILTSGLGLYGAITEYFYFIAGYVVLLMVILIFEMSISIVGFHLRNDARSEIQSTMTQTLSLYSTRLDIARVWDDLQMDMECCGIAGVHDWVSNRIPVSCCHIDYGTISPFVCMITTAHSTGCAAALADKLGHDAYVLGVIAATVTCLQVLITTAAGWLAWRAKFEEVELEQ